MLVGYIAEEVEKKILSSSKTKGDMQSWKHKLKELH